MLKIKFLLKYSRTQKLNEFINDLLVLTNMKLSDKNYTEPIDIMRTLESAVNSIKPKLRISVICTLGRRKT